MWRSSHSAPKDREVVICYEARGGVIACNAAWSDKHSAWLQNGHGPMVDEILCWADMPKESD